MHLLTFSLYSTGSLSFSSLYHHIADHFLRPTELMGRSYSEKAQAW
jgi:hypothetical protein